MTDYKKYALGQVENFLHDAMGSGATPQEIYDTIRDLVQDNLIVYTKSADQARELLNLLNGHRPVDSNFCDKDDTSQKCTQSWSDFWEEPNQYTEEDLNEMCAAAELEQDLKNVGDFLKQDRNSNFPGENTVKDKVKKWIIPVDDDYNITFPEDLIEQTGWKEGDILHWIPQNDNSFIMKKVEVKN
tara:strand:- start:66 stop:623 length:558 start_codon:yes stop_codon:yes gene_type:complete